MESLSAATAQSFHLLFSGDAALWIIIFTSFSVSVRAILIAAPFAFLAAFLMAHLRYPGRRAMIAGFSALQSIPAVVVGLTVYLVFSRSGPLGDLKLLFTHSSMIIGQILLAFPLLVALSHAAFQAADRRVWGNLGDTGRKACACVFYPAARDSFRPDCRVHCRFRAHHCRGRLFHDGWRQHSRLYP